MSMINASRVRERLAELGISQSELGRRVGVTAGTINALVLGKSKASTHLPRLATALGTTAAYLEGETDDPGSGADADRVIPVVQYLSLPVALPAEEALAYAFKRVLKLSRGASEDELCIILAKRLPTIIQVACDAIREKPFDSQGKS